MRLIATDLDGTLLNSKSEISRENKLALLKAQEKGVKIVLATGRMFNDAKNIFKDIDLDIPYIISSNGSMIHNYSGEEIHSFPIDKDVLKKVLPFLQRNNYYYALFGATKLFEPKDSNQRIIADFYKSKIKKDIPEKELDDLLNFFNKEQKSEIHKFDSLDEFFKLNEDVFNLVSVSFDIDKLNEGKRAFRDIPGISIFSSNTNNFEIINENCSKGNALEIVAESLGVSLKEIMTIGDNFNDVSMLKKSKISVAMGNAHSDIKEIASFVTLDNNNHGVAHAIDYHL
ncbi:Cof-type HAD-IIB family hydrolase [Clostridium chrysemydis]|uniref:Cof-type HAD-IIB family hydrolase n=1 Tax=Clostridium chrysemydis TaxID=2665504 RepID=UPI003F2A9514